MLRAVTNRNVIGVLLHSGRNCSSVITLLSHPTQWWQSDTASWGQEPKLGSWCIGSCTRLHCVAAKKTWHRERIVDFRDFLLGWKSICCCCNISTASPLLCSGIPGSLLPKSDLCSWDLSVTGTTSNPYPRFWHWRHSNSTLDLHSETCWKNVKYDIYRCSLLDRRSYCKYCKLLSQPRYNREHYIPG